MDPLRVDLDDDGTDDWILTMDADAVAYRGYLYESRGSCAHYVGSWEPAQPMPVESSTRGLRDLDVGTPCKPACCPTELVSRYTFDGKSYRKASERTVTRDCGHHLGHP
jgi:hypothetical protein